MSTPVKVVAAAAVLITAGIAGGAAWADEVANTSTGNDEPTAAVAADQPRVAAPSDEVMRSLAQFDVSVEPIVSDSQQVAAAALPITVADATRLARAGSGIGDGGVASTATLARVTLGQYGTELENDPNKPSRIVPFVEDREAWVIVFDDTPIPVFGPRGYTGPSVVNQPLVAFIDPATGEFLAAISY